MAAVKVVVGVGLAVALSVAPHYTKAAIPKEDTVKIFTAVGTATGTTGAIIQVTEQKVFDIDLHLAEFMAGRAGDLAPKPGNVVYIKPEWVWD